MNQKRFREESTTQFQAEHAKMHKRIGAIYDEKLDGQIDAALFDAKRGERNRIDP
ncbi:MAG: hypothetical protein P8J33_15930 [Pirellulaceae bacterium]|nr:hypothetical protein [Pirellulaceae bacterium]